MHSPLQVSRWPVGLPVMPFKSVVRLVVVMVTLQVCYFKTIVYVITGRILLGHINDFLKEDSRPNCVYEGDNNTLY